VKLLFSIIIVGALAASVSAQDAALKERATHAGLYYEYDKFNDFESVNTESSGLNFSYAGYVAKSHHFMMLIRASEIMYDDNAIFLINGERFKVTPSLRHYRSYGSVVDRDLLSRMVANPTRSALQIGSYEHEFTPSEIQKIKKLLNVVDGVDTRSVAKLYLPQVLIEQVPLLAMPLKVQIAPGVYKTYTRTDY
jgi:hypothetical protein